MNVGDMSSGHYLCPLWERGDYQAMADYRDIYVDYDMDAFRQHNFDSFLVPVGSPFVKTLIDSEKVRLGRIEDLGSRLPGRQGAVRRAQEAWELSSD